MLNQRGASLMIVMVVLGVLIAGLLTATMQMFTNSLKVVTMQRDRIAALQVLQDFAVLAGNASAIYEKNGGNCSTPAGAYFNPPNGFPTGFCWAIPFGAPRNCIRNPIGAGADICLTLPAPAGPTSASSAAHVASLTAIPQGDFLDDLKSMVADAVQYRKELVAEIKKQSILAFGNQAYAIRPKPELPDDAGSPSENTMNNIGCNAANSFNQVNCKVCRTVAGPLVNGTNPQMRCIELRVCVNAQSGCRSMATFRDWYRQRIGVLPR